MARYSYGSGATGFAQRRIQIAEFGGVDQSRGLDNRDISISPDAENFISRYGELRTAGGIVQYGEDITIVEDELTSASLPRLFQAFFRDVSGNDTYRLIASINRKIFAYNPSDGTWSAVGTVSQDGCDMVNYRYQDTDWAIFTDGGGKMYYWDGTEGSFGTLSPTQGGDPVDIEQIILLYERLFGAVNKDSPDRIYWSDSFAPTNWEINMSLPDEGGGFLDVATFDGGRIRAIVPAFDDLLIFKDRSVHKVTGTYPGEFQLAQVFGTGGTLAPRSIVLAGTALYFLSSDGLCKYDGSTVYTLRSQGDRKLKDSWAKLNAEAIEAACAVFYDGVIYLSVSLDTTESRNTHVIEYNVQEGTYSVVALAGIDDFLVLHEGQKETLLAISWDKVFKYDTGASFNGDPINAVWTSPEIDIGTLASKKQTGWVYVTVAGTSLTVGVDPEVKISMISGDKVRSKIIPLSAGKNHLRKKIRIRGRNFRFRIESVNGNPLTIYKGMEIAVEEDFD